MEDFDQKQNDELQKIVTKKIQLFNDYLPKFNTKITKMLIVVQVTTIVMISLPRKSVF